MGLRLQEKAETAQSFDPPHILPQQFFCIAPSDSPLFQRGHDLGCPASHPTSASPKKSAVFWDQEYYCTHHLPCPSQTYQIGLQSHLAPCDSSHVQAQPGPCCHEASIYFS